MGERWVSTAKWYCEYCNVWEIDRPNVRKKHDASYKHKGNVQTALRIKRQAKKDDQHQDREAMNEIERLRATVMKEYKPTNEPQRAQQVSKNLVTGGSTNNSIGPSLPEINPEQKQEILQQYHEKEYKDMQKSSQYLQDSNQSAPFDHSVFDKFYQDKVKEEEEQKKKEEEILKKQWEEYYQQQSYLYQQYYQNTQYQNSEYQNSQYQNPVLTTESQIKNLNNAQPENIPKNQEQKITENNTTVNENNKKTPIIPKNTETNNEKNIENITQNNNEKINEKPVQPIKQNTTPNKPPHKIQKKNILQFNIKSKNLGPIKTEEEENIKSEIRKPLPKINPSLPKKNNISTKIPGPKKPKNTQFTKRIIEDNSSEYASKEYVRVADDDDENIDSDDEQDFQEGVLGNNSWIQQQKDNNNEIKEEKVSFKKRKINSRNRVNKRQKTLDDKT